MDKQAKLDEMVATHTQKRLEKPKIVQQMEFRNSNTNRNAVQPNRGDRSHIIFMKQNIEKWKAHC